MIYNSNYISNMQQAMSLMESVNVTCAHLDKAMIAACNGDTSKLHKVQVREIV